MSESHELYKKYKDSQIKRASAQRRGSPYVSDYEKDERIAQLEWREKEREEKEDFNKGFALLSLDD